MRQPVPGGADSEEKGGGRIDMRKAYKVYSMDGVEVRALQKVTLHVRAGEYVAIMGPSGSGKSTMMNLAGCLDRPTSGSVLIDSKNTRRMKERELAGMRNRCIGFVFQSFNLLSRTTALANVEIPLLYGGVTRPERHRRAREALESVGLGHRTEHRPSQLSGGEQQRVAIARALVNHPRIILADEPTGNLDSRSGGEVLRILDDLWEKGMTLLLVTHDRDVAEHARRIIHLQDGRIVSEEERR
jgi:putative ABC transport system ATP-binding protein